MPFAVDADHLPDVERRQKMFSSENSDIIIIVSDDNDSHESEGMVELLNQCIYCKKTRTINNQE